MNYVQRIEPPLRQLVYLSRLHVVIRTFEHGYTDPFLSRSASHHLKFACSDSLLFVKQRTVLQLLRNLGGMGHVICAYTAWSGGERYRVQFYGGGHEVGVGLPRNSTSYSRPAPQ